MSGYVYYMTFYSCRQLGQEKRTNEELQRQVAELETRPPLNEYKILADELDSEKTRVLDTQVRAI